MPSLRAAWQMLLRALGDRRLVAVLVAIATGTVTIAVTVDLDGDDPPPKPAPGVTHVDGPDKDTKRDDKIKLTPLAQQLVEQAEKAPHQFDLGGDLRGADPTEAGVITGPLASQEWPGCKTAFVKSFSTRTRPVKAIALHYTAGGNLPGWADLDGLTAYSNRTANQVSWHFGIDREGHCTYNVPVTQKAWTISGLNSETINLEIVGTGREADYAGTAGMRRVGLVVRRAARIYGVPLRLGATDGRCNVTRKGIITHWMGGGCSGGHVDIRPYDIRKVVAKIATGARPPITVTDRATCRKLTWWRTNGRPHGLPESRAVARRKALERRRLSCVNGRVRRA